MGKTNFEIIISKYLNNEASTSEMDALAKWLEHDKNYKLFKDYVSIHHTLNSNKIFDGVAAYNATLKVRPLYKNPIFKYAVAASLILFISLTFIFNDEKTSIHNPATDISNIKKGTDKATLTLEDGSEITLEKNQDYVSNNVKSNGKDIIYKSDGSTNSKLTYNHLTIPRGGQFFVQLSDGTKVWLNSETKLKYPTQFVNNEIREVALLYGEAYFDVSESTKHNGAAFKVTTNTQEINVLGTEFNIKTYNDDAYTTLVEGKVAVSNTTLSKFLKPGEQARTKQLNNAIDISKVDVSKVIAWKNGLFIFKNESLEDIMTTLSRWYNVTAVFKDPKKKNMLFSGQLPRKNSIQSMLSKFEKTGDIKFEINDNTIIIK